MALKVKIINPDKILFNGEADYVLAPGTFANLGILPGHTPLYAELCKGEIFIQGQKEELLAIESGIIRVQSDQVTILVGI